MIGPPYFPLDEDELLAHFEAAARACAPLPFYLYEFAARSGYAIPLPVIARLRERAPNLAGLKVSDSPWEKVAPYLSKGSTSSSAPRADRAGSRRRRRGIGLGARGELPRRGRTARARSVARSGASVSVRCGRRSSGCRSTRRRRRRSGCAACPWGPTCARPCAGCATTSAPRSSGSSPTGSARDSASARAPPGAPAPRRAARAPAAATRAPPRARRRRGRARAAAMTAPARDSSRAASSAVGTTPA